jgi:hypothetical protein
MKFRAFVLAGGVVYLLTFAAMFAKGWGVIMASFVVLIWASFVSEIFQLRTAVPPLSRGKSFALTLIAGMTVGLLLSFLVVS